MLIYVLVFIFQVKVLLSSSIQNFPDRDLFENACINDNVDFVRGTLNRLNTGNAPLDIKECYYYAGFKFGSVNVVKILVEENNININLRYCCFTPLYLAFYRGDIETVLYLKNIGAQFDEVNNVKNSFLYHCLSLVSKISENYSFGYKSLNVLQCYLICGGMFSDRMIRFNNPSGQSLLHLVIKNYLEEAAYILLQSPGDINIINDDIQTPLHCLFRTQHDLIKLDKTMICDKGLLDLFVRFINLGADMYMRDKNDYLPINYVDDMPGIKRIYLREWIWLRRGNFLMFLKQYGFMQVGIQSSYDLDFPIMRVFFCNDMIRMIAGFL